MKLAQNIAALLFRCNDYEFIDEFGTVDAASDTILYFLRSDPSEIADMLLCVLEDSETSKRNKKQAARLLQMI